MRFTVRSVLSFVALLGVMFFVLRRVGASNPFDFAVLAVPLVVGSLAVFLGAAIRPEQDWRWGCAQGVLVCLGLALLMAGTGYVFLYWLIGNDWAAAG